MNKIIIGITSIGSGVAQSIIDSCKLSNLNIEIIGFSNNPFSFGAYDCSKHIIVPSVNNPTYINKLLSVCINNRVKILFPAFDTELLGLSKCKKLFENNGIKIVLSGDKLIKISRNKLILSNVMRKISKNFVQSYSSSQVLDLIKKKQIQFPLISKPISGSSSKNVYYIKNLKELRTVPKDSIIQKIIYPSKKDPNLKKFLNSIKKNDLLQVSEISVQLLFNKNSRLLGSMSTLNKLSNGIPVEIVPFENKKLNLVIKKILPFFRNNKAFGPINLQGRLSNNGPIFFEINPRYTGITGMRALMGFNEVEKIILDLISKKQKNKMLEYNPSLIGLRQVKNRVVKSSYERNLVKEIKKNPLINFSKKIKILISGGSSYLGKELIRQLKLKENKDFISKISILKRTDQKNLFKLKSNRKFYVFKDFLSGKESFSNFDIFIHLSSARMHNTMKEIAESLKYTSELFDLCAKSQISSVVYASSQIVYGKSKGNLFEENHKESPENPYAVTKYSGELMLNKLKILSPNTKYCSLRISRLFGLADGMKWHEVPHTFIKNIFQNKKIILNGGDQAYDLINVKDAANAIVTLLKTDLKIWPTTLNISSGKPISLKNSIKIIKKNLPNSIKDKCKVEVVKHLQNQKLHGLCNKRAKKILKWSPKYSFSESVAEIINKLHKKK